ncbi:MAG: uroporphyrinogen decarboxylase [Alphaproteobacteria bacterium]|nr:uroporphyrinogen decarboxylase [Alphaproteobacteria bacterium]
MPGKRLIDTLRGEKTDRPPFWFMRQAGRYLPEYREIRKSASSFLDLCYTPGLAAEITMQPVTRFGMDAAILFSDILVVPHALGQEVRFVEGEGPKLVPVYNEAEIARLSMDALAQRIAPVCETLRRVKKILPADKALIGFAGAPWTVACYMVEGGGSRDFEKVRGWVCRDPKGFARLIDRITEATIVYLTAQAEAGAEALQLFDSWAGVLGEAAFASLVIAPARRIADALKMRFPQIPLIGFPRLAGANYLAYAGQSGMESMSIDYSVPLGWTRAQLQPQTVLQGNLDPMLVAENIDAALAQAEAIRRAFGGRPFVFNLGHGMLPHTPVAHVQALSDYLKTP